MEADWKMARRLYRGVPAWEWASPSALPVTAHQCPHCGGAWLLFVDASEAPIAARALAAAGGTATPRACLPCRIVGRRLAALRARMAGSIAAAHRRGA